MKRFDNFGLGAGAGVRLDDTKAKLTKFYNINFLDEQGKKLLLEVLDRSASKEPLNREDQALLQRVQEDVRAIDKARWKNYPSAHSRRDFHM